MANSVGAGSRGAGPNSVGGPFGTAVNSEVRRVDGEGEMVRPAISTPLMESDLFTGGRVEVSRTKSVGAIVRERVKERDKKVGRR